MKIEQKVNFYDEAGDRYTATVIDIVGKGASHYKRLALTFAKTGADGTREDFVETDVPHEADAPIPGAFWLEKGETRKKPEARAAEAEMPAPIVAADNPEITKGKRLLGKDER